MKHTDLAILSLGLLLVISSFKSCSEARSVNLAPPQCHPNVIGNYNKKCNSCNKRSNNCNKNAMINSFILISQVQCPQKLKKFAKLQPHFGKSQIIWKTIWIRKVSLQIFFFKNCKTMNILVPNEATLEFFCNI